MKEYDPALPLIFIHVPKSGGKSVKSIFQLWYGDRLYPNYYNERTASLPEKLDLDSLCPDSRPIAVYGHFNRHRGFGIEDYYPEVKQFLTIIRDPFETAISNYYFIQKIRGIFPDQSRIPECSLREFLLTAPPNILNHFPRLVTRTNYRSLIDEYFIFIGVMEHLEQSVECIRHKLGMPKLPGAVPHLNRTVRDEEAPESLREVYQDQHPLEFEVYQYVLSRMPRNETPADFSA